MTEIILGEHYKLKKDFQGENYKISLWKVVEIGVDYIWCDVITTTKTHQDTCIDKSEFVEKYELVIINGE